MLMALGMFVFSIPTLAYDDLSRKAAYRHAATPRVGARDAAQFTGPGEETVSISGSAFAEVGDGGASIARLRSMGETGESWALVDGAGLVWGSFVLLTVDEKHRAFFPDGTPRQIDFSIELLRVDDDNGGVSS
jgi:phage protein U